MPKILTLDNIELYEKLDADLEDTMSKFHDWWNKKSEKYKCEGRIKEVGR